MRILQIRLKNLNSLLGEWAIDLTHPAYLADGLFAITGPTGAGKTTLLDAICLALYGCTPRLPKISKAGNELMARHSGECFAEVVFETATGRYRSHWSQHRARRKPGGELQNPKHELAHADTGVLIDASLRGVATQIEALTGMDFERFTRAMLLAQGGFAAFLQAAPDQRAPLLEQITGTGIYSDISIAVHARRGEEQARLNQLEAALQGVMPLSTEAEQQVRLTLEHKQNAEHDVAQQLQQVAQAIRWLEGIAALEAQLQHLADAANALAEQRTAFAPQQARLEAAQRAIDIGAAHAACQALRHAQAHDQSQWQTLQAQLPSQRDALAAAEAHWQEAQAKAEHARAAQQQAEPLLQRARQLDWQLTEATRAIAAATTAQQDQQAKQDALRLQHQRDAEQHQATEQALQAVQQQLLDTQADAPLVETLSALQQQCHAWQRAQAQQTDLTRRWEQAAQATRDAEAHQQQCATHAQQLADALHTHQQALADLQTELAQCLQGANLASPDRAGGGDATLSAWRQRQATWQTTHRTLQQLQQACQAHHAAADALQALHARTTALEAAHAQALQTREHLDAQHAVLANERDLLETQLSLLQRIASLEDARHQLEEGQPCPLCGAMAHPFATGQPPQPDATRQRLEATRRALAALLEQRTAAIAALTRGDAEQTQIAKDRHRLQQAQADAQAHIEAACGALPPELGITRGDPAMAATLQVALDEATHRITEAAQVIAQAEAIEHRLGDARAKAEQGKDLLADAQRQAQAAVHRHDLAAQQRDRLQADCTALATAAQTSCDGLATALAPYGVYPVPGDAMTAILQALQARRDQWLARQRRQGELQAQLTTLAERLQMQQAQFTEHQQTLAQHTAHLEAQQQALNQLRNQRHALLPDRTVDDEAQRLSQAVAATSAALERATEQRQRARDATRALEMQADSLTQAMQTRTPQLAQAEAEFAQQLHAHGFADEAAFAGALLPPEERAQLTEAAQQLAQAASALSTTRRDKTAQLHTERAKAVSDAPLHELQQRHAELTQTQRAQLQEIGTLREQLLRHEQLVQQRQAQLQALAAQQQECTRWQQLHELIGSADGKKYRNFAQGLTFEVMIGHANRQLQCMTDRYLLVRDAAQPLELMVIDSYQGGEVRSTKNLSGGESFIVSLALALGLSQMASQNVRVDSLFLDEGFGTLDEDALDTALQTLASLQQEGKLIGVISHVQTLKDRIATQIQVTPLSGGRSTLAGPGCRPITSSPP